MMGRPDRSKPQEGVPAFSVDPREAGEPVPANTADELRLVWVEYVRKHDVMVQSKWRNAEAAGWWIAAYTSRDLLEDVGARVRVVVGDRASVDIIQVSLITVIEQAKAQKPWPEPVRGVALVKGLRPDDRLHAELIEVQRAG